MTTSLNDIEAIEKFLDNKLIPQDSIVFKARLLIDSDLRKNLSLQKKVRKLVTHYGRHRLSNDIKNVEENLFFDQRHLDFQMEIDSIFHSSS
jgi:hypothetical protein